MSSELILTQYFKRKKEEVSNSKEDLPFYSYEKARKVFNEVGERFKNYRLSCDEIDKMSRPPKPEDQPLDEDIEYDDLEFEFLKLELWSTNSGGIRDDHLNFRAEAYDDILSYIRNEWKKERFMTEAKRSLFVLKNPLRIIAKDRQAFLSLPLLLGLQGVQILKPKGIGFAE